MKQILFLALIFGYLNSFALAGKVKGLIVDGTNNKPLEYASVVLYLASDSSLVAGNVLLTGQSREI